MEKNIELEKRFGAKLAYVRKARKLSQIKLAEIVNMSDKLSAEKPMLLLKQ